MNFDFVIYRILVIIVIMPVALFGQVRPDEFGSGNPYDRGGQYDQRNQFDQKDGEDDEKDRNDSIVSEIHVYKLKEGLSISSEVELDTSLVDFHVYNPVYKNNISAQTLGNMGLAFQSNDFFERERKTDFLFLKNHEGYGKWKNDINYFNTTTPYTHLGYGQWFSNRPLGETWVKVIHSQNINPFLNLGFYFNSINSQGKYLNQEAKDGSLGFFLSYNSDRYDIWFTLGNNRFRNEENGGLPNPESIENPDLDPQNIPVWFDDAKSEINSLFISVTQQYKVGQWKEVTVDDEIYDDFTPRLAFMHSFDYVRSRKSFYEVDPLPFFYFSEKDSTAYFYGEGHVPNINGGVGTEDFPATQDNYGFRRVSNKLHLKVMESASRKYSFGKQAFIGNDFVGLFYPQEELMLTAGIPYAPTGLTQEDNYTNSFVGGSIYRSKGKFWNWAVTGKYYIQGYKFGDFDIRGDIVKPIRTKRDTSFLRINGFMRNSTADYFYDNYYSNHFAWNNNFDKTYNLSIEGSYEKPGNNLKIGAGYSIINNYIFMNRNSLPEQAGSEFSVYKLFLNKDFVAGALYSRNWIIYQGKTTDKYLEIPTFVFRNSTYLQTLIAKVLYVQVGIDLRYESSYYADNYNPATGLFYRQDDLEIGNYPWLDAFFNFKLKRTRVYVKYSNIGTQFFDGGYFTSPAYPEQIAALSFGVSWSFYD
jgi:hypothetical protein